MSSRTSRFLGLLALVATVLQLHSVSAQSLDASNPRSSGCTKPKSFANGLHSVTVNGTKREFIVRLPDQFSASKPYKLVVALHWYGATMDDVVSEAPNKYGNGSYFGLLPFASQSSILVAPNGIDKGWMNANNSDLLFLDAVVSTIETSLCVDTTQRFAVGFSFGGSMAYAVANTRAKSYRAVAILSGTDYTPWTGTTSPISVFVSHGVSDPANPIAKGRLMRDRFISVDGCPTPSTVPEPAAGSGTHITTSFGPCASGRRVQFVAFDGVHQYSPVDKGQTRSYLPWMIWDFFTHA